MAGDTVLIGNLEFLSLGDVLQLLGTNNSTGVLHLKSKYAQDPADIFISEGNPVDASNGRLNGLDAINSLFGWTVGQFEFEQRSISRKPTIQKSRMNIILDSLSMLDEGAIEKLGPVSFTDKASSPAGAGTQLPVIRGPIIDYMYVVDEEDFADGHEITSEGKHGNWIWVILEGKVDIVKQVDGSVIQLLTLSDGAFVGSTASFLMGGNVRGATAIASGNVQLGVLDSQRLAGEFAQMSTPFKGLVSGLDRRLRSLTDHVVNLRQGKTPDTAMLQSKSVLLKQGDSDERVFSLSEGEAVVVKRVGNAHVPLTTLSTGDIFGRLPFLDIGHEPDAASVIGGEDVKTVALDAGDLRKEFDGLSTTFRNLLEHVATSITVTTKLLADTYKSVKPVKKP